MEGKSKKVRGGNLLNDLEHLSGEARLYVQVILRAISDIPHYNKKWKDPLTIPLFLILEADDPLKFKGYKTWNKRLNKTEANFLTALDYIFNTSQENPYNILWHLEHMIEGDCAHAIYCRVQEGALTHLLKKPEIFEYVMNKYSKHIREDALKNLVRDKLTREN
jgi:hypothetical protein